MGSMNWLAWLPQKMTVSSLGMFSVPITLISLKNTLISILNTQGGKGPRYTTLNLNCLLKEDTDKSID
jgi:hypothetical protein